VIERKIKVDLILPRSSCCLSSSFLEVEMLLLVRRAYDFDLERDRSDLLLVRPEVEVDLSVSSCSSSWHVTFRVRSSNL
jgi:hypothetical protein